MASLRKARLTSVLTDRVFIFPLDRARQAMLAAVATTISLYRQQDNSRCPPNSDCLPGYEAGLDKAPVQLPRDDPLSHLSRVGHIGRQPHRETLARAGQLYHSHLKY